MPFYKFKCSSCENEFKKKMSMAEAENTTECSSCGHKATRDYGKINVDETSEFRDPKSARYWKNNLSSQEQSRVMAGERDPY
jgi:putative FmdB family regulatory protein